MQYANASSYGNLPSIQNTEYKTLETKEKQKLRVMFCHASDVPASQAPTDRCKWSALVPSPARAQKPSPSATVNYRNASQRPNGGLSPQDRLPYSTEYTPRRQRHPAHPEYSPMQMQEGNQKAGHACIQSKQQPPRRRWKRKPRQAVKMKAP